MGGEIKRALVMRHHLFHELGPEQLERLYACMTVRQLVRGERLFHQGEAANHFFLIASGQVKLYRLSPSGGEKVVEIISAGETFAEALMFLERPAYPLDAEALADTTLYAIDGRCFLDLLATSVATCFRVMGQMSLRLKHLLNEVDALTLQNASLRLVNYLLGLLPEEAADGVVLTLPATKQVIASRLSVQPETLSRILTQLMDQNLIHVEGLQVSVLRLNALRNYTG